MARGYSVAQSGQSAQSTQSVARSATRPGPGTGSEGPRLLVAHDALAALVAVDPGLVAAEHRATVRAGRDGVVEVRPRREDATVRWVDRLHLRAADRLVDALVAADVSGPAAGARVTSSRVPTGWNPSRR